MNGKITVSATDAFQAISAMRAIISSAKESGYEDSVTALIDAEHRIRASISNEVARQVMQQMAGGSNG